jgi:hypothetical protein
MKIKLEAADLERALKIVSKLAPPTEGRVSIYSKDGAVVLSTFNELNSCKVLLPATLIEEGEFCIFLEPLRNACQGHTLLQFEVENTILTIKGGGYAAKLATVDKIEEDIPEGEELDFTWVSAAQAAWLKGALSEVSIRLTALLNTYVPLGISLTAEGAFVACFDRNRMAFIQNAELTGDIQFVVPLDTFQSVLGAIGDSSFDIAVTANFLEVQNEQVKARLSLPSTDENTVDLATVMEKAAEISQLESDIISIEKEKLTTFLANAKSVTLKERAEIQVSSKGEKLHLTVQTPTGKIKAAVTYSGPTDVEFLIDYDYFDELVRKCGPNVELTAVGDAFAVTKTAKGAMLLVAFQSNLTEATQEETDE